MHRPRRVVAFLALALTTACGGDGGGGPSERTPTTIAVQAGNFQSARYGTVLPTAPSVIVTDAQGPIPDYPVTFTVASGGGTITGGSTTTNASGVATVGSWTLGPTPGANTLTATAGTRSVTISATALTGTPSVVAIEAGNNQQGSAGSFVAVNPAVKVTDGTFPVAGVNVTFAVTGGGGSVQPVTVATNAEGVAATAWRLGPATGANTMTATVTGLTPATFTATAVPLVVTSIAKISGDGVSAYPGNFTPVLPVVEVRDQFGAPVPSVAVTFTASGGGGSVAFGSVTTGNDGRASPGAWRFGGAGAQQLTASVTGITPAVFNATLATVPASQFNIQLVFLDPQPTAEQRAKFEQARARWQQIIVGDIPDFPNGFAANSCGSDPDLAVPAIAGPVDDVVIFAGVRNIDGAGQILAQAGPCQIRSTGRLTIVGIVSFDDADITFLEGLGGGLADVAFHEMGHVLGFGTLWNDLGVLQFPATTNVAFTGAAGKQGYANMLNQANPAPASFNVPVENCDGIVGCGEGTRDGHWREPVFTNEIMTGYYNVGTNPFSAMSAASMRDLGYVVNDAVSDAFTLPIVLGNLRMAGGTLPFRERLAPWPIRVVDQAGRTVGEAVR